MGSNAKKSTKKFEKNRLKDTLERRKDFAKIKQKKQIKAKKQARRAADYSEADKSRSQNAEHGVVNGAKGSTSAKNSKNDLAEMTVDEFFQGGFEITKQSAKKQKNKSDPSKVSQDPVLDDPRQGKKCQNGSDDDASEASDSSTEEVHTHTAEQDEADADLEGSRMHKADLQALSEKDPEFYKYLQENDAELLDFDEDLPLDEFMSEDDNETEGQKSKTKKNGPKSAVENSVVVTPAVTEKWHKAMKEQHSMRAMRQAILAFRAAAHVNSEQGDKGSRYRIPNPESFNAILLATLEGVPIVLSHHLPTKESVKTHKTRVATDSKRFRSLSPLIKIYVASVLYLLETLSDSATIKLTIDALVPLLPYVLSFKKLLKALIKVVVNIWATPATTDEAAMITSYLLLRRLAVLADASIRETLLKSAYQALIQAARNTNPHTLPLINLLKNSCVDLWTVDANMGYTTGFVNIRQLALHLRSSIQHPTKESYKTIYNWQYVHSLDFWSRVLSAHCSPATNATLKTPTDSAMHPLIYPVVQITLGALRLIPTPAYFPLRFHLIKSLLRISRTTNTYIPLVPPLLEVLDSPEMKQAPKPSTLSALDFNMCLRAPKAYLRTRTYQDGLGQEVQELLADFFACWSKSIAFPELVIPPTVALRRWLKAAHTTTTINGSSRGRSSKLGKGNKNAKVNAGFQLLLQKMQLNVEFVQQHRSTVTFTPQDREQVENFLRDVNYEDTPMGAFAEGLRKQRQQREEMIEAGRQAENDRRKEDERGKEDELRDELQKIRDQSDSSDEDLDEQFASLQDDMQEEEDDFAGELEEDIDEDD